MPVPRGILNTKAERRSLSILAIDISLS
jgi:hypothetical protein